MKYYVVSDLHSFYTPFMQTLEDSGFFGDKEPHKLIICGDFFDRGGEALQMQRALSDLIDDGNTILLRGNHEDLMVDMLDYIEKNEGTDAVFHSHYRKNGTLKTLCDLTGGSEADVINSPRALVETMRETVALTKILPAAINYYETSKYVFVHGWLPCREANMNLRYLPPTFDNWRNADANDWKCSRWMDYLGAIEHNLMEPAKTVICGHRSTRYGNISYSKIDDPDHIFDPFVYPGLIAIDATTVLSGKVNCIIVEDD